MPVLASLLLDPRFVHPLDGGRAWRDGRPLLGRSKTWRGLVAALTTTPLMALLLALPWSIGLLVALGAMLGDLIASFSKRRLGLAPGESAHLLDEIPEALMAVVFVRSALGLSLIQAVLIVVFFGLLHVILMPVVSRLRAAVARARSPREDS